MSEEKLYAVKNAKGLYLSMSADTLHRWREGQIDATTSQRIAHDLCTQYGGHVVTFVEEPKKVVLTNEQAEIVEDAHEDCCPAMYISKHGLDEQLLINAYVNGYTVAKEKKYNVKVPHTKEVWYYKSGDTDLLTICPADKELRGKFTESEIEHYGLQDCEKEEVTDDDE
ncbi:hypothetical protein FD51_GL000808 [Lacticaseibacillus zeae DSM 20178 = KCTC 3804]|uniref:DUF1642 domain-containing protein n=1 Tax=Lacticaseibacillus zeae DSM 20178 = KCTC 3804 TaxID=1423816 RepID=A0A0R1EWC5_LACZE|nr:DUF1642 domain-containing protein [Lacticaseibacillus zeae]KRK11825.1 hypothetical protein FD51_GL000808 [Lacticaseibacillus zeae DSM 20178 = KCTC 3804]